MAYNGTRIGDVAIFKNLVNMKHIKLFESFSNSFGFSEAQIKKGKELFQELFDVYLKKVNDKYPFIYHCTTKDHYESIKTKGLTSERNYFLEWDNDLNSYGFSEEGDEIPGIACGVDYRKVIDRLYPDPEWHLDIAKITGNPSQFDKRGISDDVIYALFFTKVLNLDIDEIDSITDDIIDKTVSNNMFAWLYVKGKVAPNLIKIEVNEDAI
jgi:hypothetical protein